MNTCSLLDVIKDIFSAQWGWLALICIVLVAAFIYVEHKEKYVPAVILKGLASACFVTLGRLGMSLCGGGFAKLVFIGLALGLIADVMLNMRFVLKGKAGTLIFLVGILVFLAGHVLYLAALLGKNGYVLVSILSGIVLAALLLWYIFTHITAKPAFKIFGIFYIGAVSVMTTVALGAFISNPGVDGLLMFFIGALFFLVSDVVLILNTFGSKTRFSLRITNLSLYYLGQLLIAFSLQFM